MKRVLIIGNPRAGISKKEKYYKLIKNYLSEHFDHVEIIFSKEKGENHLIAKQEKDNYDLIVAWGGDGTINEVGTALINTEKPLGIIPGGSGNGLARGLNIPLNLKQALNIIANERDIKIDVGKINDKYFLNVAGVGFDAKISYDFNSQMKKRGILGYIYCGLINYSNFKPFELEINQNGNKMVFSSIIITAFANFREYGGKAIIAPFASPYDGMLDICIVTKMPFLKALSKLNYLFSGKIHKLPTYQTFKIENLKISLDKPEYFHYDGEIGYQTQEINISIFSRALKVRII
ncbi:MAG: diacylglycerol kinase family protein [Acidobacteriota bacterium]